MSMNAPPRENTTTPSRPRSAARRRTPSCRARNSDGATTFHGSMSRAMAASLQRALQHASIRPVPSPVRMGTYSIVAVDRDAGQIGAAVQTHWFNVGAIVPWVAGGVGAVATQANVDVSYGPRGLALLRHGRTPEEAVAELVVADPGGSGRQLAIAD